MGGIAGTSATVNAVKQSSSTTQGKCFSCGAIHFRQSCKFREVERYKCHKNGHISRVSGQFNRSYNVTDKLQDNPKGGKDKMKSSVANYVQFNSSEEYTSVPDIC